MLEVAVEVEPQQPLARRLPGPREPVVLDARVLLLLRVRLEIVRELADGPIVSGCLVAPVCARPTRESGRSPSARHQARHTVT